eukprot:TRINITY_DN3084_c0_g1_i2.p1 TRINITY_DN3084_c0_g1~~TRINITY_DN3084_c0_g1_i2.p1  ORF type:complete len:546 (+),score=131.62 TRINITY_DN3084_c0_g1_i2:104-1741(+)
MAVDFPSSVIREIQIQLRKGAGVPSYDPGAPAAPLPTLGEAIAAFDPSPPHLRCNRCRGSLLRGLQSLICVYCGAEQRRDAPLPPISFTSTFGYRRLLESLHADGSEAVAFTTSDGDSTRGQVASKDGMLLSDLLNLDFKWPEESKDIRDGTVNKVPNPSEHSVDMTGVDLDNFFSRPRTVMTFDATKEIPEPNEQIESTESLTSSAQETPSMFENLQSSIPGNQIIGTSHVSSAQESLSMFDNIQSSGETIHSAHSEGSGFGDSFSVWEAEFQSASSGTHPVDSNSADPSLISSTINPARPVEASAAFDSGMDMKFEINDLGNNGDIEKTPDQVSSLANNWTQDDTGHANDTKVSNKMEHFEVSNKANEWFDDDLWQSSTTRVSSNAEKTNETDDSLDLLKDFASSRDLSDPLSSWPQVGTQTTLTNGHASKLTDDSNKMEFSSFSPADLFSGESGIQKGSTGMNDVHLETSPLDRKERKELKTGVDSESQIAEGNAGSFSATSSVAPTDPNVEMLLSQLHDLSFMLEDNLSIPQKVEGTDSIL